MWCTLYLFQNKVGLPTIDVSSSFPIVSLTRSSITMLVFKVGLGGFKDINLQLVCQVMVNVPSRTCLKV
jgi:hypothetical protein